MVPVSVETEGLVVSSSNVGTFRKVVENHPHPMLKVQSLIVFIKQSDYKLLLKGQNNGSPF